MVGWIKPKGDLMSFANFRPDDFDADDRKDIEKRFRLCLGESFRVVSDANARKDSAKRPWQRLGESCRDDSDADGRDADEFEACEPPCPVLVTTSVAAEMLAICPATLRKLTKRDLIRRVEFVATSFARPIYRYRVDDLHEFAERFLK